MLGYREGVKRTDKPGALVASKMMYCSRQEEMFVCVCDRMGRD